MAGQGSRSAQIAIRSAVSALFLSFTPLAEAQTHAEQTPPSTHVPKCAAPQMRLKISAATAEKVGRQVWLNETGGKSEAITAWNASEDFASLGIGHFIWFPEGLKTRFVESFPTMLLFVRRRGATLPKWLDKERVPPSPWKTKAQFDREFFSPRTTELRRVLLATIDLQAQFLVRRLENALPKLLAALPDQRSRIRVRCQFYRVASSSPDLYPLIDYVNFKGEGVNKSETFQNKSTQKREGWGLKHVLLAMKGSSNDSAKVLREYSGAARFVLLRRIANNPRDRRWQAGWMVRVKTYRRPLP